MVGVLQYWLKEAECKSCGVVQAVGVRDETCIGCTVEAARVWLATHDDGTSTDDGSGDDTSAIEFLQHDRERYQWHLVNGPEGGMSYSEIGR